MDWADEQDLAVDGGSGGGGGGGGTNNSAASSSSSSSFDDVDSADDIVKLMVIFCSVVFVVFTFVYLVLWRRGKRNNEQAALRGGETDSDNDDDNKTSEFVEGDEDGDNEDGHQHQQRRGRRQENQTREQPQQLGRIRYSEAHEPVRERQPGDPVYDKFLVSGTMSLGIILWIGATIVLIVSLIDNADHTAASSSDFQSLGPDACRIVNASSYAYFDSELTSQQTICVEQWEYLVEITVPTSESDSSSSPSSSSSTYFVSAPIAVTSCGIKCDLCQREGPGYYAGVDSREKGVAIAAGGSSPTLVECWEPTIPVDDLSDFYDCGSQRSSENGDGDGNSTCYLLVDSASQLKVEQQSSQIGIIVACVGYGVGLFLIVLSSYWIRKNRRIREKELLEQQEQSELETKANEQAGEEEHGDEAVGEVDGAVGYGGGGGGNVISSNTHDSSGQTTSKGHGLDKESTSPLEEEEQEDVGDDDEEKQTATVADLAAGEKS